MQLKMSIKLYRQTTETLIAEFMKDAAATGRVMVGQLATAAAATAGVDTDGASSEVSYGEVQLEVRASRHPATGEFDGTIRGKTHPLHAP